MPELELNGIKITVNSDTLSIEITDSETQEIIDLWIFREYGLRPGDPDYSRRLDEKVRALCQGQVEGWIEFQKESYAASQNPVHVWQAFLLARGIGFDLPEWIMGYFEQAAVNLDFVRQESLNRKITGQEILSAFGLEKAGQGNIFTQYHKNVERQAALAQVEYLNKYQGETLEAADSKVAEEMKAKGKKISEATIKGYREKKTSRPRFKMTEGELLDNLAKKKEKPDKD